MAKKKYPKLNGKSMTKDQKRQMDVWECRLLNILKMETLTTEEGIKTAAYNLAFIVTVGD